MASLNSVTLIGNLGADPELKSTQSGRSVCNLRLAVNESWKDKGGQKQERTEWFNVVAWAEQGENCAKYLSKGRQVCVVGRLQNRTWEDKDGQKRYATDIVADRVVFLGGGERGDRDTGSQIPRTDHDTGSQVPPNESDDAPF